MASIFDDVERKQRQENNKARKEAVVNFTKDKFDKVTSYLGKRDNYVKASKDVYNKGYKVVSGVSNWNPSDRMFRGGAGPSVGATKRFASNSNSKGLMPSGSFEERKKKFGRID
jgi:hypothetical protein